MERDAVDTVIARDSSEGLPVEATSRLVHAVDLHLKLLGEGGNGHRSALQRVPHSLPDREAGGEIIHIPHIDALEPCALGIERDLEADGGPEWAEVGLPVEQTDIEAVSV